MVRLTAEQKRIKELEKEVIRLQDLAHRDELTKLYNRHGFKKESAKFVDEAKGYLKNPSRRKNFLIKNFSLAIFDIDDFKKINDTYGHQAGDLILKVLSKTIMGRVREVDMAARWGGEEIILGLVGADEDQAFNIAEDIRKKAEETTVVWKRKNIKFTISGGVASLNTVREFDALFKEADDALYKAKKSGKNRIIKSSGLQKPDYCNAPAAAIAAAGKSGGRHKKEGSHSGLVRSLGKRVCRKASQVRILYPPPVRK